MLDDTYHPLGQLDGADVGVQSTPEGHDIFIRQSDTGQSLACLLGFGKADIVRQADAYFWRIAHDKQVDDLLVELIDLLISIRYAHPTMVQLELALSDNKGMMPEPHEA
jgi:hypothetical protein